jgi:hypothetical protein
LIYATGCESSGAVLLLARCGPGPRKKLVKAIVGPEIDQTGKAVGKPGLGIAQFSVTREESSRRQGSVQSFPTLIWAERRPSLA